MVPQNGQTQQQRQPNGQTQQQHQRQRHGQTQQQQQPLHGQKKQPLGVPENQNGQPKNQNGPYKAKWSKTMKPWK